MPDVLTASIEIKSDADTGVDDAQSAQLRRFEQDLQRPTDVKAIVSKMEELRKYVHTDANLPTTPGGVATNYLLRYQWIHQAQVYAKDPAVAVRPKRKLGTMVPTIQQIITDFGRTVEYLVQHYAAEGKFRQIVDGCIQDADTAGIVFIKVNWIEDMDRDPTGTWRPTSTREDMRRLTSMAEDYAEGKIAQDSPEYAEFQALARSVKDAQEREFWRQAAYPTQQPTVGPDGRPVMGDAGIPALEDVPFPPDQDPRKLRWQGLPTVPQITQSPCYRGFVFDPFDAEDVWWDFRIRRPELINRGEHVTTRVWMEPKQIAATYGVDEDDTDSIPATTSTTHQRGRDGEERSAPVAEGDQAEKGGCLAVLERQQADGHIYTWVQGARKYLRYEKREISTSYGFNVFPVYFNRVSGRVLPVSNTELGKPLQDEINLVRTHKRQGKRAAYSRFAYEDGLFDDQDVARMQSCPPNGWVPFKKPVEDIKKRIMEIPGKFDPQLHDVLEERQELGAILNVSQASQGMTRGGSDSATEAAIANQTQASMSDRHKDQLVFLYGDIFTYMAEVLVQALPEENAKAIAGPGAVWPMIDREALWAHLQIDIEAGSTGKPDQEKRLAALNQAVQIGQAAGIGMNPAQPNWNAIALMRKLSDILDWREDPAELLAMPPPMPMAMPGSGPLPPSGHGPGPSGPPRIPPGDLTQPPQMMPPLPMANRAPEVAM